MDLKIELPKKGPQKKASKEVPQNRAPKMDLKIELPRKDLKKKASKESI
ncbi:hypothetical protein BpHYR1_015551 [Brachionus plicatilis]|uniref:Uncharacterized protein n=1 Tax=Brachionus plicatilis TaxID=10195 RepID=A0A3M7R617_BRAPC|nr:hypothetical protein BpHYR1_015551 [Brachionus plicatilis]